MSKTLDSYNFGDKLYNSIPEVYRTEDEKVNFALKRYLEALSDGGFAKVIEETNNILNLVDSEKIDAKLLPILFKSYGFEIFNGVPEMYLRKLLPVVSNLFSLKGSITSVEFLTSIISGVKSTIDVSETFSTDHAVDVILEMDYGAEQSSDLPDRQQLLRIIRDFVPFFCNVTIVFSYFFDENARTYVLDSYHKDFVHLNDGNEEPSINLEDTLLEKVMTQFEDVKNTLMVDFNSLIGNTDATLTSTLILNNVSSYDIIRESSGKKTIFFS